VFGISIDHKDGKARAGVLATPHGPVRTPAFMPVGTAGAIKGVTPDHVKSAGAEMVLANTYHLLLRPGPETVAALGGVHGMMAWDGPILTDSGGYQVFSLSDLRRIDDEGATFQSHIDGSTVHLTPRLAIQAQRLLGADVIMQLDECPPGPAPKDAVASAVRRSAAWAAICKGEWLREPPLRHEQALFGIQQGGMFADLRAQSAAALVELDLPGYAVGGLSVGEGHEAMLGVLEHIDAQLPADRPRYLMGVGEPRDILAGVRAGIDMFDCVLPTRNGRNAQAFTFGGRVRLRNARWSADANPLEEGCDCYACKHFSRGTLRHLFAAKEMLGPTLVSIHNLRFFSRFMESIRDAIAAGAFERRAADMMERMHGKDGAIPAA
jgi:queuine tRNA-ribosyltransferase